MIFFGSWRKNAAPGNPNSLHFTKQMFVGESDSSKTDPGVISSP